MADSRMVSTEIRKRMGAPVSHLTAAQEELGQRRLAALHEIRRLAYDQPEPHTEASDG